MAKTRSEKRIRAVFSSRQWTDVMSHVISLEIYTMGLGSAKRPRFGEGRGQQGGGVFLESFGK